MNLAQVTCNYFNTKTLNKFYCNTEYVSYGNFSHLNLSKINLPSSAKIIAFGLPQFDFIPTKIKNSIREAVVISTIDDSNIFADSTNNWIKKHKDKNHHSLFYKKIFKALLHQKIKVVTDSAKNSKIDKEKGLILSQKYILKNSWKPSIMSSYFENKKNNEVANVSKKFLIDQLSASPVFVVKNGFNEIILGHPAFRIKRGVISNYTHSFSNLLKQSQPTYPISTGLFFFHPDDAFEFKNFIKSVNPLASEHMEINVEPVGLHFAYKMNRNVSSDTQFLFIPDFKEVGDLLFKYKKDKHLIFHKDQCHGKNFFQGQPIYIIQPTIFKDRSGNLNTIQFTGLNDNREVIFTSLEAANKSWTNFIKNNSQLKSIRKPTLLVYNLESFLKDQERLNKQDFQKFVVITNKKAYLATKELVAVPDSNSVLKHLKLNMKPKLFFIKLWVRRLFSTLTYE
uniref:Uncharacterized protein n=1 Tax=Pyropia haitanensis TaxID=1262161 RepID=M9PRZ2_PYRHA|nr:hypothetical protein 450 [Neoporphyra haitanensis]AGG36996.1 hypothetical protein 450 [Neoporphyra haitanensis]